MKKRTYIYTTLLFLAAFLGVSFMTNSSVKMDIKNAFTKGNAKQLSVYMNDMLEFYFENTEGTLSRSQVEFILLDFFSKNPPKTFTVKQEGTAGDNSEFVIATYTNTNGCRFRIYYVLKKQNKTKNEEQIVELNISKGKQCPSKI
ncbi:MAG: DUF4783 domain-containing protein [Bacteroidales bacterium]|nr:DUF4783 domain-containing protein [Bacteroidales bacterium]